MIVTNAARETTSGTSKYHAYWGAAGLGVDIDLSGTTVCHFGISSATSTVVSQVLFPLGLLWLNFEVYIIAADAPGLQLVDDMNRSGVFFKNLANLISYEQSKETAFIERVGGHHIHCSMKTNHTYFFDT